MSEQVISGDQARLERAYRRILTWYPRSFRRDNEDEILAVLLDTAAEGQVRVGLAEAWDLVRGAVRMRLWPAAPRPRAVRTAVKLMLAGAAAELATMITVVVTSGAVRAAVAARNPSAVHAVMAHEVIDLVATPVAIGLWLWLAWANGKGEDWGRVLSAACFGVLSLTMLGDLTQHAATYAPASMIAAAIVWTIGLASVLLTFTPAASRYYRPQLAQQ
jgi:hypothetical protein